MGAKELGISYIPLYSLFNGEPRSYLELSNHQSWICFWLISFYIPNAVGCFLHVAADLELMGPSQNALLLNLTSMGDLQDPKMEVLYPIRPYFVGYIART